MLKRCIAIASKVIFTRCSVSSGPMLWTFLIFFFVVLNHLASPIFRNHTTPVPPQVGTLLTSGYARAASAITSWNAVCSITCRLGSQEKNAIRQACTYGTSWSGMHSPLSFLTYPTTFMFQHAESKRHHCNKKTHSLNHISFQVLPCHLQDWP